MHITDLIQVETINGYLRQNFRVLDGRPIYRLVWSDDQLEIRKGKFSDWYGKIFIREYEAVREIKKYWYIKPPCWVLEKLIFMANAEVLKDIVSELVTAQNGTYEPVYSFKDAKDNPLPVDFEVVQFILQALHSPARKVDPELARRMQEKEEKEEVDYFVNELSEGERSPLFVWDNGAFVSSNQLKYAQEYKESKLDPFPLEKAGAENGPIITGV